MKQTILKQLLLPFAFTFFFVCSTSAQNSINGMVLDSARRPVSKIDVELLDEFERLIKATKTAGSGLYFFQGLPQGNYYVQVRVDGTGFMPAKERVQLGQGNRTTASGQGSGAETAQINFNLQLRIRSSSTTPAQNEVVFAQEVPDAAKERFENAGKLLDDKKIDAGVKELEGALAIFPDYYLALDKLGFQYLNQSKFTDAERIFQHELKVNAKSISARSGLGIAQYKLGKKEEAAASLELAVTENPASARSNLFLGKIYRDLKQFEKAEVVLKKARSLESDDPDIHWELALLYYYNLKRPVDAAEELEAYLKTNPKTPDRPQIESLIKTIRKGKKQ